MGSFPRSSRHPPGAGWEQDWAWRGGREVTANVAAVCHFRWQEWAAALWQVKAAHVPRGPVNAHTSAECWKGNSSSVFPYKLIWMGKCIDLISCVFQLKVKDPLLGCDGVQRAVWACIFNAIYLAVILESYTKMELGLSLCVKHTAGIFQPQENAHCRF